MLKLLDFFRATTNRPVSASDDEIVIVPLKKTIDAINSLSIGDHTYFVLAYENRGELVKYVHTAEISASCGWLALPVTRAVDGATITSFPTHSCLYSSLTSFVLHEYIKQVMAEGDS